MTDHPFSRISTRVTTQSSSVVHKLRSGKPQHVSSPPCSYPRASGDTSSKTPEIQLRRTPNVSDCVTVSNRFEGRSRCSAVAPNGTVWTGETDGSIVIRLAPSGVKLSRIEPFGSTAALVIANVSGRMWAGYSDGAIRVFDHATRMVLLTSRQHTAALYAICDADGFVYTGGADWKVHEWDATDLHYSRMYHGHRNTVRSLTTYIDEKSGCRYIVSGSDDGTVKVWDVAAAKIGGTQKPEGGCVATLEGKGRGVLSMLVFEDTGELWVGCEDSVIRVWSLHLLTTTAVVTAHRAPVVTLQRVGEAVWSGSKDGAIAITDRLTKNVFHQASQPPARGSTTAGTQRVKMSILPVTRSLVYNVWATAEDGSWLCWNYAIPNDEHSYVAEPSLFTNEHHPFHSRQQRRPPHMSESRSHTIRSGASDAHHHNEALRECVAQTRHNVAALLTKPTDVTFHRAALCQPWRDLATSPPGPPT
ncbi:hypothetical protein JKF63_05110 [Porcisia hertigi]|uniref:Uncharacterized protein n=1 Tax=Porcisia hertigi TaxID=2761500 RepID=A0A836LBI0_9TRYP|nr:hypothetical protein JKF63_05110 [Porcisia hertigi]